MKGFRRLPNDVLSIIFQNLSYEDYCRFICSSKKIYEASLNIPYKLDLKTYTMGFIQSKFKPLKLFQNIPNFYFNKEVILLNDVYSHYENFEIKPYFENSLKYIESFIFDSLLKYEKYENYEINSKCDDFKIQLPIYLHNSKIKKPRLSGVILDDNTIINSILLNSKNLQKLEIIEQVHFNRSNPVLNYLPKILKVLNVSGVVNLNDKMLDIITRQSPYLLKLDISRSHITDKGTEYLKRLRGLNTCNLSFTRINDDSLEIIGELPNLRKINVSMCRLITNTGIGFLVQKNPHLTHLSMEFTNVGQMAVIYMTNYLKNPMYINLDYTHYAEFLDVSKLKQKCKVVTYKKI